MSETTGMVVAQLLPTIAALGAAWIGWQAKKAVQEVHVAINSRLTALLDTTAKMERAAGKLEGRAEAKNEGGAAR